METFDLKNWFNEFYIHKDALDSQAAVFAQKIINIKPQIVNEKPYIEGEGLLSAQDFDHSKKRLFIAPHSGHFFRKCPGTQGAACCNYFVLNLGTQCNMNCSYCYLQSYINTPLTQIYSNLPDALAELDLITAKNPHTRFRVGTGETIDSLSLDDLTHYSASLVSWFREHPRLTCEFKSKSDNIKNFIDLKHAGNVVVSFSINPEQIVKKFEHRTASLERRLMAARKASDRGFPVAFHIDPMIYTPHWENLYRELVDQVALLFRPEEIKWVSVGALRFQPSMKQIMRERFGAQSLSVSAELFLSDDGKLRYDQNLRSEMFNSIIRGFRKHDLRYPVFLCMESSETWLSTYNATPRQVPQVADLFGLAGPVGI